MDDETLYEYVRKAVAERVKEQYSQSFVRHLVLFDRSACCYA